VEASIDRLKVRAAIAIPLAAALDDWVDARLTVPMGDAASWEGLVDVARGIDPEPLRDKVRATWRQSTSRTLDELQTLADSIDLRAQHPATLTCLAHTLQRAKHSDAAIRLLRDAQYAYPEDFWLNLELCFVLRRSSGSEAIRYGTAAVAVRPTSAIAH